MPARPTAHCTKTRTPVLLELPAVSAFIPAKNLGACGEGGAVVTDDADINQKIRMIRDHGQEKKYFHMIEGYNGRLDAIQAGVLRIKLQHLAKWNEARRANAAIYDELIADIPEVVSSERGPLCRIGVSSLRHLGGKPR